MTTVDLTFHVKRRDHKNPLRANLPSQILTGATVQFHMAALDGTVKVDAAGAIVQDGDGGAQDAIVEYQWSGTDTDTAGVFRGEFEITFPGALPFTFPNDGHIWIHIDPDLA